MRRFALSLGGLQRLDADLLGVEVAPAPETRSPGANNDDLPALRDQSSTLLGTKTKRARRTFWMSPIARPFLERCLRELASVPEEDRADFTFDRWSNVRRDLHAACDRAGAPHVSYNDLRRTFATLHARGGVAREDLVRMMGHADDTMLRRIYDQTDEADHVRAARERYARDHAAPAPAKTKGSDDPEPSPERRSA
jgi:hypothetical protein